MKREIKFAAYFVMFFVLFCAIVFIFYLLLKQFLG